MFDHFVGLALKGLMFFLELFEVPSWFDRTILQEKEEQVLKFSFQQLKLEVVLNTTGPKIF